MLSRRNGALKVKELFEQFGATVTFKQYPDGHGVTPENLRDLTAF